MSLIRLEEWSEDAPRFERIRKTTGPLAHTSRTRRRDINPTANMMRGCVGKHSYTRASAEAVALRKSDGSWHTIGAYRCHYCHRWHIGHNMARLTTWRGEIE